MHDPPSTTARTAISRHSRSSCTKAEFVKALAVLTAAKLTAKFTTEQVRVWYAFLSGFQSATIRRAVAQLVATEVRFPELADFLQICRKVEPPEIPYGAHGTGEMRSLYESELQAIAGRLGWDIGRVEAVRVGGQHARSATGESLESEFGRRLDAMLPSEVEDLVQRRLSPHAQTWFRENGMSRGIRSLMLGALREECEEGQ